MNAELFHSNAAPHRPDALRNLLLILTFSSATVFALSCLIPIGYVTSLSVQGYPRVPDVLVQISGPLSMLYAFTGFSAANLLRLLFDQITPGQGPLVLGVFNLPVAVLGMGAFYSQVRSYHHFIRISAAYTAVAIAAGGYLMGAISAVSLLFIATKETTTHTALSQENHQEATHALPEPSTAPHIRA